nr:hypothetical protein BaRGS_004737 [Batillaria attramentaria]
MPEADEEADGLPFPPNDQILSVNETTPDKPSLSSLSREISQILEAVREKNRQLLGGRRTSTFKTPPEKSLGEWNPQSFSKTVPEKPKWTARPLPNTRYRCRTCIERLRDNLRFRQAKRLSRTIPGVVVSKEGATVDHHKAGRLSRRSTLDLSVKNLDLSDNEEEEEEDCKTATRQKTQPVKPRGYSRKRMERLAEPRVRGTKPRPINVSGKVLRRQAEVLRRPHETSQISEREREHRRQIQSRVRLFLALLQLKQVPSGMVHIPQRDDIMTVDISHIGRG